MNVRRIFSRPVAIGVLTALALAAVVGGVGPSLFRPAAAAAASSNGTTSVEAALGVAPVPVTLAAVSDRTAVALTTAAAVSAKSAPALSAASLPLVKPKGVSKPKAAVKAPARKPVAKAAPRAKAKPAPRPRARVAATPVKRPVTRRKAAKKAPRKAAKARKGAAPGYGGPRPGSGGGAERWRPVVRWYLKRYGVWSQSFEDKAIHIMNGESSGDPRCETGDYVGLYQFNSSWMSRADRLNPYTSICRFVRVYKAGGIAAIRSNWAPTFN